MQAASKGVCTKLNYYEICTQCKHRIFDFFFKQAEAVVQELEQSLSSCCARRWHALRSVCGLRVAEMHCVRTRTRTRVASTRRPGGAMANLSAKKSTRRAQRISPAHGRIKGPDVHVRVRVHVALQRLLSCCFGTFKMLQRISQSRCCAERESFGFCSELANNVAIHAGTRTRPLCVVWPPQLVLDAEAQPAYELRRLSA